MAGDAAVRDAVHGHYGDELAHSAVVGATHHDRMGEVPEDAARAASDVLLRARPCHQALGRLGPRTGFEQRLAEAWRPYRGVDRNGGSR